MGVAAKHGSGWDNGMMACTRLAWTIILLIWTNNAWGADAAPPKPPMGRVLVDSIHAHNYLKLPEDADLYSYHVAYGHRKAFGFLRERGVAVDEIASGRLTDAILANRDMLFINLVSADLPPFYVSEIRAIKAYVEA